MDVYITNKLNNDFFNLKDEIILLTKYLSNTIEDYNNSVSLSLTEDNSLRIYLIEIGVEADTSITKSMITRAKNIGLWIWKQLQKLWDKIIKFWSKFIYFWKQRFSLLTQKFTQLSSMKLLKNMNKIHFSNGENSKVMDYRYFKEIAELLIKLNVNEFISNSNKNINNNVNKILFQIDDFLSKDKVNINSSGWIDTKNIIEGKNYCDKLDSNIDKFTQLYNKLQEEIKKLQSTAKTISSNDAVIKRTEITEHMSKIQTDINNLLKILGPMRNMVILVSSIVSWVISSVQTTNKVQRKKK